MKTMIAAQARLKELCEHLKWRWTPSRPLTSRWMKSDNLTRALAHLLRATCATVQGLGDQSLKCPIKMTANVKLEEAICRSAPGLMVGWDDETGSSIMRLLLLTTALTIVSTGALAGGDWVNPYILQQQNDRALGRAPQRRAPPQPVQAPYIPPPVQALPSEAPNNQPPVQVPPSEAPNNQPSVQVPPSEAPYNQSTIQAPEGKRGFVIPPTVSFDSTPTPAMRPTAPLATPPAVTPPSAAPTYAPTSPSQYHSPPFAKPKEEPLDWFTIFWAIVSVPFLIIVGLFSAIKRFDRFRATPPFLSMFVGWIAVNSASRRAEKVRAKQERKQEEAYRTSAPLPPRGPLVQG